MPHSQKMTSPRRTRLRTGHCGLRHHLCQKLKIDPPADLRACSKERQTPFHILPKSLPAPQPTRAKDLDRSPQLPSFTLMLDNLRRAAALVRVIGDESTHTLTQWSSQYLKSLFKLPQADTGSTKPMTWLSFDTAPLPYHEVRRSHVWLLLSLLVY